MDNGQPRLTIWIDATGRVQVNGPISNKGLCYMMLECAKDAIRDFAAKNQAAIVVPETKLPRDMNPNG